MTIVNEHGYIFAERDSEEWNTAWQALANTGRKLEQYMLMHGEPDGESTRWGFKHIHTRKYTYVIV